jgi:hypothetical protein
LLSTRHTRDREKNIIFTNDWNQSHIRQQTVSYQATNKLYNMWDAVVVVEEICCDGSDWWIKIDWHYTLAIIFIGLNNNYDVIFLLDDARHWIIITIFIIIIIYDWFWDVSSLCFERRLTRWQLSPTRSPIVFVLKLVLCLVSI